MLHQIKLLCKRIHIKTKSHPFSGHTDNTIDSTNNSCFRSFIPISIRFKNGSSYKSHDKNIKVSMAKLLNANIQESINKRSYCSMNSHLYNWGRVKMINNMVNRDSKVCPTF